MIILFQGTLKNMEKIFRNIAGLDMSYDAWKELCGEEYEDDYRNLHTDACKKTIEEHSIQSEDTPKMFKECSPETSPFQE